MAADFCAAEVPGRCSADAEGLALQAEAAANPRPVTRSAAPASMAKRVRMWLVLWLRNDTKIRLRLRPALRVLFLGLGLRHRRQDDHVVAILPVHRRRHLV